MEPPEKKRANQRLREERLRRHWSQQELADRLGTTVTSVKRWERKATIPGAYFRIKLMALFGKNAEELGFFEAVSPQEQAQNSASLPASDAILVDGPLLSTEASLSPVDLPGPSQEVQSVTREQNQARMIELIAAIWITGMLERSLHGATLQALGLYERPDVVANPWHLILQDLERPERLLPIGTSIAQVYDATNGYLLILGDPGSGKTTLLLELARTLLHRARQDPTHPIPVVFNLSSWVVKRQPLEAWMIEELQEKYQVPRTLGKQWLKTDTIIPLLDGLDEVAESRRSACVEVINRYRQSYGLVPIVVCSRYADYIAMGSRILLRSAVIIQPLQPQQITDYLAHFGEKVEGLRHALDEDEELQTLATTPFMLNILALTYADVSQKEVLTVKTQEDRRRSIFEQYVERMLKHRSTSHHSTPQQMMAWLIVLAKQVTAHQETVLYIERIQFDWLAPKRIRHLLPAVCIGLLQGIFIGIVFTFFCLLFHSVKSTLIIGGVLTLWNVGFGVFLNGSILAWFHRSNMQSAPPHDSLLYTSLKLLSNRIVYGIVFALLNILIIGLLFGLLIDLRMALLEELKYAIFYGCLIGGALLVQGPVLPIIQPAETVIWTWKAVRQNALRYVTIGIVLGFVYGLIYPIVVDMILILFAIAGSILAAGISHKALEPDQRIRPNQGIRRSGRNSLQAAIVAGVFTSVMLSISFGYFYGPLVGVFYSLAPALAVSVCFALQRGGTAYLLHFIVRWLLWWEGQAPWRYVHFLDEAVDHIILRKVGGGYIFIHRYVLEYFASLEDVEPVLTDKQRLMRRRILQSSLPLVTGGVIAWWALADLLPYAPDTPLYVYVKHKGSVNSIAISPDSKYIASGSDDTTVRIWDAMTGTDLAVFHGQVPIVAVAWSPDGTQIAIGKKDGVLHLWDVKKRAIIYTTTEQMHEGAIQDIHWSPDGQMFATLNKEGVLRIWHYKEKKLLVRLRGWPISEGRAMTWSPNSARLAFVATHTTISIWNIQKERSEETLLVTGHLQGIAWAPDEQMLAACVYDGWVQTWDTSTYQQKSVYRTIFPETSCLCWSPDSQHLITSESHQSLQIWNVKQETALATIYDQGGIVHDVQYAPDTTFFASAIADTTVRIWKGR